MSETVQHLPFELLSEQIAKETINHIYQSYGSDPNVIGTFLSVILKDIVHDNLELGMMIADQFGSAGPGDIAEAYRAGYKHGEESIK